MQCYWATLTSNRRRVAYCIDMNIPASGKQYDELLKALNESMSVQTCGIDATELLLYTRYPVMQSAAKAARKRWGVAPEFNLHVRRLAYLIDGTLANGPTKGWLRLVLSLLLLWHQPCVLLQLAIVCGKQ